MIERGEETSEKELIAAVRLTRDLKRASASLREGEARYLVDLYYNLQDLRIAAAAQVRSSGGTEPNALLSWTTSMYGQLETDVQSALKIYVESRVPGQWLLDIMGIGPVIAAGLLAHIDITRCKTAGALWRYAGLDPTDTWGKGEKRPWNARLKVLCWKAGQSFVKSSNRDGSFYGPIYKERKAWETARNLEKAYRDQAERTLREKNISKETEAYKWYSQGMLPPAQIQARAERYAVKIFLSHVHTVLYNDHYRRSAPCPYAIQYIGHAHEVRVPDWVPVDSEGKPFDPYLPYIPTDWNKPKEQRIP